MTPWLRSLLVLGLLARLATADTVEWTGAVSSSFGNPSNWLEGRRPANSITGDTAVFRATPAHQPFLDHDRSLSGLVFEGGSWTLGADPGTTLRLWTGGMVVQKEAAVGIQAAIATGPARWWIADGSTLRLGGPVTPIPGGPRAVTVSGGGLLEAAAPFAPDRLILESGARMRILPEGSLGPNLSLTADGGILELQTPAAVRITSLAVGPGGLTLDFAEGAGRDFTLGTPPPPDSGPIRILGFDPAADQFTIPLANPDDLHAIRFGTGAAARPAILAADGKIVPSGEASPPPATTAANPVSIADRRELFLDDFLIDRLSGEARRVFHRPTPREIALEFDRPWEGNTCGYVTVFRDGDRYRMYYRATQIDIVDGKPAQSHSFACYAESADGIHWTRPDLGLVAFKGSTDNNILRAIPHREDTFVVFRDPNPEASPEAAYKAVSMRIGRGPWKDAKKELAAWTSPDGIRWALLQPEGILSDGAFDSQNVVFWDPNIKAYRAYYRVSAKAVGDWDNVGRDIRTATSENFTDWTPGTQLAYASRPSAEFYTNVIRAYPRAPHLYIGFPGMYADRGWDEAAAALPDADQRLARYRSINRSAPLSDTQLMWSRNGVRFDLAPSTFLPPGPERSGSWVYGSHWVAWYPVETIPMIEGAAPELSFYANEGYYSQDHARLRRHTLRLDGFASIHAPIAGGELLTPPLTFEGDTLRLNFATSAFGGVRVEIQDAAGAPLPGFTLADSVEIYGDSVDRPVVWNHGSDVSTLAGRAVRLRFVLRDADLYALRFGGPDS